MRGALLGGRHATQVLIRACRSLCPCVSEVSLPVPVRGGAPTCSAGLGDAIGSVHGGGSVCRCWSGALWATPTPHPPPRIWEGCWETQPLRSEAPGLRDPTLLPSGVGTWHRENLSRRHGVTRPLSTLLLPPPRSLVRAAAPLPGGLHLVLGSACWRPGGLRREQLLVKKANPTGLLPTGHLPLSGGSAL